MIESRTLRPGEPVIVWGLPTTHWVRLLMPGFLAATACWAGVVYEDTRGSNFGFYSMECHGVVLCTLRVCTPLVWVPKPRIMALSKGSWDQKPRVANIKGTNLKSLRMTLLNNWGKYVYPIV